MAERPRASSAHISPSAHYTGFVWYRHQLAAPAFVTGFGRWVHALLRPITWGARVGFGLDLESLLLQRHLLIDARLTHAIEHEGVEQVVEIACGLSPRGRRFSARYPQLRYLEADLPQMAARKRLLLAGQGWLNNQHQVKNVDILADQGADSLAQLFAGLDPTRPVAVITEGLVNYFELAVIEGFWSRLATQLQRFPQAIYLTELYPDLQEHPLYLLGISLEYFLYFGNVFEVFFLILLAYAGACAVLDVVFQAYIELPCPDVFGREIQVAGA